MAVVLPDWFSIVRKEICHRTGVQGLKKILETGAIRPNDGSFADTYPQSKESYARAKGYVSLFDFGALTDEECVGGMVHWYRFFFDQKPVTMVLLLDRPSLSDRLIPNRRAQEDTNGGDAPIFLPDVEVFYPGQIPCAVFTGYVIICGVYERLYEYIPCHGPFPGVFDRVDAFLKKHEDVYRDPLGHLEKDLHP